MKAAVLEQNGLIEDAPLRLADLAIPEPGKGEVRVKVRCCAVCRTDLHVVEGELPAQRLPIIPGHQAVGVVDALGPGCACLQAGQRVGVAWLRRTCGECAACRHGRENLCEASEYTGYHANGGFAEYLTVPETFAYCLPDVFEDVEVAPLLCGGIIGYRALSRCNVPDGGRLALYGFGSSAHIVLQIAKHRGFQVYVVTRGETRQELARRLGADWAGATAGEMPDKADSAIIFAPAGELVPPALEMLAPGGTLALAGIYMTDVPRLEYEKHLFHEREVRSVAANTREDGRRLFEEAAEVPVKTHTSTYPLSDANRALQDLKAGRVKGTGVLVMGA